MRRLSLPVFLTGLVLLVGVIDLADSTPTQIAEQGAVHARPLAELFAAYWADTLRLDPTLAMHQGERAHLDTFDESLEDRWRADKLATLKRYQLELSAIDTRSLSAEDRRSVRILTRQLREDLAYYGGPLFEMARRLPIDQFQGRHLAFAQDAAGSGAFPFKTVEDYDLALRRADGFARWVDDAIGRMNEGLAHRVVLPRMVVGRMLPQMDVHLGLRPEDTEFWQPIAQLPADIPETDRARLTEAYRIKIQTVIQPAYRRLHDYLAQDYLPYTRDTVGLGALPQGHALYRRQVRFHTTTNLSPKEIHALGRAEVDRIGREVDRVQATVGFKGTRAEFLDHIRSDPAQHFKSPEEVVPAYQAATARIVDRLPKLFGTIPKTPYEIRPLPPESSKAFQGNGDYWAPAADGSRPGILWMNIYAPGVLDRFNVMTISLHEGLPGHHFQAAVALEQPGLPAFRRSGDYTAFIEGWGLYAESLGKELGVFEDPWQYYGHLNYAILRANRLVIDTGMHELGWSLEQGIRWMMDHSSMTRAQAAAEVERYVAYPGQALAYKVGELKIRALRNESEKTLGARFDVRSFHDRVLKGGPVPLTALTEDIRQWVREPNSGGR
jgi:uncharacterized protein (DUF885 family)